MNSWLQNRLLVRPQILLHHLQVVRFPYQHQNNLQEECRLEIILFVCFIFSGTFNDATVYANGTQTNSAWPTSYPSRTWLYPNAFHNSPLGLDLSHCDPTISTIPTVTAVNICLKLFPVVKMQISRIERWKKYAVLRLLNSQLGVEVFINLNISPPWYTKAFIS